MNILNNNIYKNKSNYVIPFIAFTPHHLFIFLILVIKTI